MSWTTFRPLTSGLDMTWTGDTVTGETHTIPVSSPYTVYLDRVPKVLSTGTSVLDNTFSSVADMQAAGVSLTIGGVAGTITTSSSPAAGQAYFQITASPYTYSTKVVFNSADAGKAVVVNYTGYASNLAGTYLSRLHAAVNRLETLPPCALLSTNEYSNGFFDNSDADDTSLVILSSRGALQFTSGAYLWTTVSISLSAAGNTQVSGFTDVDGWKRIGIWLIDNSGTVEARITQSAEVALQSSLSGAPPAYSGDAVYCGYVDVQGDGTGSAGGIEAITQTYVVSRLTTQQSSLVAKRPVSHVTFAMPGALSAAAQPNYAISPGVAGTAAKCTIVSADMGDDDTTLQVDLKVNGTDSIFATKPSIASGGGASTVQVASSTDISATGGSWANTAYLEPTIDTVSANADGLNIVLWFYPDEAL